MIEGCLIFSGTLDCVVRNGFWKKNLSPDRLSALCTMLYAACTSTYLLPFHFSFSLLLLTSPSHFSFSLLYSLFVIRYSLRSVASLYRPQSVYKDIAFIRKLFFAVKCFQQDILILIVRCKFEFIRLPIRMLDQRAFIDELIFLTLCCREPNPELDRPIVSRISISMCQIQWPGITAPFLQGPW